VPFHEFLELDAASRVGKVPFIHTLEGKKLGRLLPSAAIVALAEERRHFWNQLRELAGIEVPAVTRGRIAAALEKDYERRVAAMRAEHEKHLADLQANYTYQVARRLAEGLLRVAEGRTIGDLVSVALAAPYTPLRVPPIGAAAAPGPEPAAAAPAMPEAAGVAVLEPPVAIAAAAQAPAAAAPADEPMAMEPYIDTALCTSCNECTNISKKLFAYDGNKQAYVKDPRGGTFQQLVRAAEQCPVKIIHPGTPLDPTEKDLDKWVARAAPFN
jgi:pyruvate-ferredoxin/flavodoxin oxidoreductase